MTAQLVSIPSHGDLIRLMLERDYNAQVAAARRQFATEILAIEERNQIRLGMEVRRFQEYGRGIQEASDSEMIRRLGSATVDEAIRVALGQALAAEEHFQWFEAGRSERGRSERVRA